jgi:outer membrane protein OmpA-like peptidoglycan-associated protein
LTSWNTAANGTGTSYAPGQSVTLSTSLTLYAQWKKTPTSILYGAVGVFSAKSATLSASLKTQVRRLATTIMMKKYVKVTLYGYTGATGVASLNRSLSAARAENVANYLKSELSALKVRGVAISAAGEGAVTGKTAPQYSRVEVFVS